MQLTSKRKLNPEIAPLVLAAACALIAFGKWPYAYYQIFRWVIFSASLYATFLIRVKRPFEALICIIIALIFNPIVPLRMHAADWKPIDLGVAVVLGILAFRGYRGRET